MLATSNEIIGAWLNHSRQLSIRVKVNDVTYGSEEITSLSFDSGSISGEVFQIGSTYMNSVQIVFPSIIESIAEDIEVIPELGVMVNGSYEYTKLGHFYVDDFDRNKNNNTTSITATDKMRFMEGEYVSKLTYPKAYREVALDVANSAGVEVNANSFASLGIGAINKPEGYTHRQAIGLIAQFEGGFASFNRNGELEIRRLAPTAFEITPESYLLKGFTKNESSYRIGGISVKTGEEEADVIRVGSTNGSQVELENKVMTQTLLNQMWELVKTLNYFPYELKWRGCPPLEAGDWIYISDKDGTKYSVPNLSYSITFNGGMSAESKATTSSTSQATYKYRGSLNQKIDYLDSVLSANKWNTNYYGSETPKNPKEGDLWFKPNGQDTEIWVYKNVYGVLKWAMEISSAGDPELLQAIEDAKQAGKNAQLAAEDAQEAAEDAKQVGEAAKIAGAEAKAAAENAGLAAEDAKAVGADAKLAAEDAKAVAEDAKQAGEDAQLAADDAREVGKAAQEAGDQALSLVDQAQRDIDLANETIGAHTIDLSKLFSDFANIDTVVDAIVIDTGEMKTAISENEATIETVKTETNKAIEDNAADIVIAQQIAESAKSKADAVEATTHTITQDLNSVTETITDIETIATSTTKTLNEVKSTVEGHTQTIATVKTTADSALSKSNTNSNTIDGIQTTLTETKTTATSALTKANSAQSTADGNSSKITSVTTTANSALSKANTAQSTADSNTSKITSVTTTANSALSKANTLEETVDGVTRTLTSVESTISNIGAQGTNLLINGGFENDLFGWTGDSVHKIDTADTHSGGKALMVDASGSIKMLNLKVKIPVYQGQQLEFSMWYKTTSDFNGTSGNNKLRVGKQDGSLLAGYGWDGAVTEWTNRVVTLTVGSGISELTIRIDSIHSAGKVWWDDISITDVTNRNQTNSKVNQISDTVDGHTQLIASTKTTADSALSKANSAQSTADGNTSKITAVTTTANSALSKANTVSETVDGISRTITSVQTTLDTKLTDESYATSSSSDSNIRKWTLIAKTKLTSQYQDIRVGIDIIGSGAGNSKTTLGRIYLNHKQQAAMGQNSIFEISISDTSLVTASDLVAIQVTTTSALSEVWYYMKWSQTYTAFRMTPFVKAGVGKVEFMSTQPFITELPEYNKLSNGVETGVLLNNSETTVKVNTVSDTVDGHTQLIASTTTTANNALSKANTAQSTADGNTTKITSVTTTANNALSKATSVETTTNGLVVTVGKIANGGSNLVTNGSFENEMIGWEDSTTGRFSISSDGAHTGNRGLKITNGTSAAGASIRQSLTIPVTPGRKYEVSFWYKTTSNANGTSGNQKLRLGKLDGSIVAGLGWDGVATEWTQKTGVYTAGTETYEWNLTVVANHSTGTVWWDDISIVDVTDRETTAAQFSVLSDQIDLRVQKDGVINAINVSTEGVVIAGNKITITGVTTIENGVIKTAHIADANISTAKIADLAVADGKIANLAVTEGKIANLAVTNAKIANLSVTEGKIGDAAITNAKIGNLAVSEAKIASLAVTEGKIGDAAITTAKIGNLAVSEGKIADLAVSSAKIANLAVTETKIGDAAITNAKIGNLAVSTAKIADGAIVNAKIGDAAITNAKIADASISSAKIISLDAGKIVASSLATITTETGTLNVTGWLTMSTENKGMMGTYDFGDGYAAAFNYRWFVGDWRLSHRHLVFTGKIYNVTTSNTRGSYLYDAESFYGNDYLKMRQYNSSATLLNRIDINSNAITMSDEDWGGQSKVIIRANGTADFYNRVQFNLGADVSANTNDIGLRTGRIDAPSNYQSMTLNASRGITDVSLSESNIYFNQTRTVAADLRIGLDGVGKVVLSSAIYDRTYSSSSNLIIQSSGAIGRSTSATKYKLNISEIPDIEDLGLKLLTVEPKSWYDKTGIELAAKDMSDGGLNDVDPITLRPYYGLIAEDLRGAGLDRFLSTNYDTGEIEGIEYDRVWVTLIPVIRNLVQEKVALELRLAKLERQMEGMLYGQDAYH